MREFLLTASAKNYKIFECALVHLGYTSYRGTYENNNPAGESMKPEREGRIALSFSPQQGQQTMNLELWSKPLVPQFWYVRVNMKEVFSHVFYNSWSWSIKLVQFPTGMDGWSDRGSK